MNLQTHNPIQSTPRGPNIWRRPATASTAQPGGTALHAGVATMPAPIANITTLPGSKGVLLHPILWLNGNSPAAPLHALDLRSLLPVAHTQSTNAPSSTPTSFTPIARKSNGGTSAIPGVDDRFQIPADVLKQFGIMNDSAGAPAMHGASAMLSASVADAVSTANPATSTDPSATAPDPNSNVIPGADYAHQPPADLSSSPLGLEGIPYTSASPEQAQLHTGDGTPYIPAVVPTPPEAMQMHSDNTGNMFNPAWKDAVDQAAQTNGGLGDPVNGFLAFSKNQGFVRLLNPNLTPEQNREMAAISLQSGWAVENLPSNSNDSAMTDPKINSWVQDFASQYSNQFQQFVQNPSAGSMVIKNGSRTLMMQGSPNGVTSLCHKKAGGLEGFMQDHATEIGIGLAVASLACPVLAPLAGISAGVASAGMAAIDLGVQTATTGKLTWQGVVGAGATALGATGVVTAGEAQLGQATLLAGDDLVENGKLTASDIASIGVSALNVSDISDGLTPAQVQSLQGGLKAGADVIDNGKLTLTDLAGVAAPLVAPYLTGSQSAIVNNTVSNGLKLLAQGVTTGKVTAGDLLTAMTPLLIGNRENKNQFENSQQKEDDFKSLLSRVTDNNAQQLAIYNAVRILASSYDTGKVSPQTLIGMLQPFANQAGEEIRKTQAA